MLSGNKPPPTATLLHPAAFVSIYLQTYRLTSGAHESSGLFGVGLIVFSWHLCFAFSGCSKLQLRMRRHHHAVTEYSEKDVRDVQSFKGNNANEKLNHK